MTYKYKWHDLRKDPKDLPEDDAPYTDLSKDVLCVSIRGEYVTAYCETDETGKHTWFDCYSTSIVDVIAWRYIEPFEGGAE